MGSAMERLWRSLKETLKDRLPQHTYKIWIAPLQFKKADADTLYISCPNIFFKNWVEENYLVLLADVLSQLEHPVKIELIPEKNEKGEGRAQLHLPSFSPKEIAATRLCGRFTFEEFVVGESNRFAYTVCNEIAKSDHAQGTLIYVHSDTGLGKSHLAHAVGQEVLQRRPDSRVKYVTADGFTSQVVKAVRNDGIGALKSSYGEKCDLLLFEEFQNVAGRTRTQIELMNSLDILIERGKVVVLTGNILPKDMVKMHDHLRSRLHNGLITTINPPEFSTRKRILKRKAKSQGILLDDEIAEFLAHHLRGDIRKIEGAVVGLIAKSTLLNYPINMELAKEVLKDLVGEPPVITLKAIKELVCNYFQISQEEISSKSRKKAIAWPRQIAMYLARKYTAATLEAIGQEFNRDHATVVHAIKKMKKQLIQNKQLRNQVEFIKDRLEKNRWQR